MELVAQMVISVSPVCLEIVVAAETVCNIRRSASKKGTNIIQQSRIDTWCESLSYLLYIAMGSGIDFRNMSNEGQHQKS